MSKLKLIITKEAYADLNSISDFIAKDNIDAAKNLIKDLFDLCNTLTEFPNLGVIKEAIKDKTVKIYIHNKQYLIAYRVENDKLVVFKITSRYQNIYKLL